jgi:predicted DNA-binding protein YlxM (UPF0122 family)
MMDEVYTISLLLDFYGQMVTKRQYEILDLHYNSDYSLGEIAQELNISRQGVFDNIKRGKTALFEMEQKLGLIGRFIKQKEKALEILKFLESIDSTVLSSQDMAGLDEARQAVRSIMED